MYCMLYVLSCIVVVVRVVVHCLLLHPLLQALIRAVRTEDQEQVTACLAWGGDPGSRDGRGWTLLHHAVYKVGRRGRVEAGCGLVVMR